MKVERSGRGCEVEMRRLRGEVGNLDVKASLEAERSLDEETTLGGTGWGVTGVDVELERGENEVGKVELRIAGVAGVDEILLGGKGGEILVGSLLRRDVGEKSDRTRGRGIIVADEYSGGFGQRIDRIDDRVVQVSRRTPWKIASGRSEIGLEDGVAREERIADQKA